MGHMINTENDLEQWSPEDLAAFIEVDDYNEEYGIDAPPIINPALQLELIYRPIGWACHRHGVNA